MSFQFRCTRCQHGLRIRDAFLDRIFGCPQCARKMILRRARVEAQRALAPASQPVAAGQKVPAGVGAVATRSAPSKPAPAPAKTAPVALDDTPPPKQASPPKKTAADVATKAAPTPKKAPSKTEIPAPKPAPKPIPVSTPPSKQAPAPMQEMPPPPAPVTKPPAPLKPAAQKKGLAEKEKLSPRTKLFIGIGAGVVGLGLLGWFLFGGSSLAFVSGTVTLESTPLTDAQITFMGEGGKAGPFIAKTDSQGRYNLRSSTNTGIPPGKYKVTVRKEGLKDGSTPESSEDLEKAYRSGKIQRVINKVYEDFQSTPLRAEVISGSHPHDFELKKQP